MVVLFFFFFSSRRRHTRFDCDWSSDVCSSDLGAIGDGLAIALRVYAAGPLILLKRWRGFAVAAIVVAVSAPFLDWPRFFGDSAMINQLLVVGTKGGQSAAAVPWLIPIAVVCLVLLGRRRAAWLLVPA